MKIWLRLMMGLLIALSVTLPAWAEDVDTVMMLRGDYVGVGAINVPTFSKSPLFGYLMDFFRTDARVKQAFDEIQAAGLVPEKVVKRIVVGVPTDVEKSEHILLWETSEDLSKYHAIFMSHANVFDIRKHQDVEYFATKRENECLALLGNLLVLGSELRVKEIIESHKTNFHKGPKRSGLLSEMKRTDKAKDAWFVWALDSKEQQQIGRSDPLVDMTQNGLGTLKMGEIRSGTVTLDFSSGLKTYAYIGMVSEATASQTANLLMAMLQNWANDADIKELGLEAFMTGVTFSAQKSDVRMNIDYDQSKFDQLIALVTQFAKSLQVPKK